jgi:propionyl-CoA synthetase
MFNVSKIINTSIVKGSRSFNFSTINNYDKIYKDSITQGTRETFWENEAKDISWFENWKTTLDTSNPPFYKWFKGGKINMSYNCLDRHILSNNGDNRALIWESAYLNQTKYFTYKETLIEVTRICKVLIDKGLKKGDRVLIYMPMIPEAVFSMLACSRLGIIHSVVFGGFAADELAERIRNAKPKMIITTSAGIEPKKKIPYMPIIYNALSQLNNPDIPILLVQREDVYLENHLNKNTIIYQEVLSGMNKEGYDIKPEIMNSNDPLYVLYTSGTTGTPKGIVREIGGTCVALNFAMKTIMGINKGDVYFALSDIGWVVGHSFIVYGPLIRGATSICYEGKPIGTPNCGKIWQIIEKHKVKSLFASPTALRAIKKEDPDCEVLKTHTMSSVKMFQIAGEKCDAATIKWLQNGVRKDILLNDNWWQTETGWPMSSNNYTIHQFPVKPGSVCKPVPGYDIRLLSEEHDEITTPGTLGNIYVKLPMPPSFMTTLWENDQAFIDKYITKDGQFYITGDAGYFDEDGYLFVQTRVDDIMNVAGHRLSTGRMEEILTRIPEIVESAVVGINDDVKGELPFAFIVLKANNGRGVKEIIENAKQEIVDHIGAISRLKDVIVCQRLPKTRSGKILRNVLRKMVNKEEFKIPPTIEDVAVLDEIKEELIKNKSI